MPRELVCAPCRQLHLDLVHRRRSRGHLPPSPHSESDPSGRIFYEVLVWVGTCSHPVRGAYAAACVQAAFPSVRAFYRLRRRPRRRTRSSSSSRRVAASSSAASRPQRQRTTRLTTLTASFRCVHRSSSPPSACCRKSTGRHPLRASCLPGDDRRLDLARAPHPRRRAAVQSAGHHSLGPLRDGADSLV